MRSRVRHPQPIECLPSFCRYYAAPRLHRSAPAPGKAKQSTMRDVRACVRVCEAASPSPKKAEQSRTEQSRIFLLRGFA